MHSNGKYSFLDEKIVYQSFYGAPLTFSYFFFKEKCLLCVEKKFIRLCLLHEDGIVEACRFYLTKKKEVNFWFNGKILSLLIIFSQLIFCQVPNCKMFVWIKLSEDPRRKNDISGYMWHRSFIQMVK